MLRLITANRWVDTVDGTIVSASVRGRELLLGDKRFLLDDTAPLRFCKLDKKGDLRRFTVFSDDWKIHEYVLFRPLIYTSAFGDQAFFNQLEVVLQSLDRIGGYSGDVLVIGDRDRAALQAIVPENMKVHALRIPARRKLDFYTGRYRVAEWRHAASYQPLLYVDSDVVFDLPVEPALAEVLLAKAICAQREGQLISVARSVGATLLQSDSVPPEAYDGKPGFNSGILGIPNLGDHADTLAKIWVTAERVHATDARGPFKPFFDQPVANYVAFKVAPLDLDTLTKRIRHVYRKTMRGGNTPLGMVHFWGAGDAVETATMMREHVKANLPQLPAMKAENRVSSPL